MYPVNTDFNTDFDLDPELEPLLGIHNNGRVNRDLVTRDEIGKTSFSAVLNRVQYGTYRGSSACLVAIGFDFRFRSKAACRYSYAEIRVTFNKAVSVENHKIYPDNHSDDPRVKNMAPTELYGTMRTVGNEKFYQLTSPVIFETEIGLSNCTQGPDRGLMTEHPENRTWAKGRVYFDDDHTEYANSVAWDLYENDHQKDGIFPRLKTAIIICNSQNTPIWMEVVIKPSVSFSVDPRRLLDKNAPFARLLQKNDQPVLLDGKTPKHNQSDLGCDDFSSPLFPWHEVLQLPIKATSQSSTGVSSGSGLDSQYKSVDLVSHNSLHDVLPTRIQSQGINNPSTTIVGAHYRDYTVAWICALPHTELLAARLMLDEEHTAPPYDTDYDGNTYIFGTIKGHKIVMATLPKGATANVNAARLTAPMFKTFPNIKIALLVGIGGGVPRPIPQENALDNVHLGDVIVGWVADGGPAVIQWDLGRSKVDGVFEVLGTIDNPDWRLKQALSVVESNHDMGVTKFKDHLTRLKKHPKFTLPELKHDRLFSASYHHVGDYNNNCMYCDSNELVPRNLRTEEHKDIFVYHQGRIATGNSVVQDGELRDKISKNCKNVLCIEMESAGVNSNGRCLVIRGVADYADSHKNDMWTFHAAGTAAAFARELLCTMKPITLKNMEGSVEVTKG